jgi:hypothetical protein
MESTLAAIKVDEINLTKDILESNPEKISKYISENFKNAE